MTLTLADIEKATTNKLADSIELRLLVPLLGEEVLVIVYFADGKSLINEAQLAQLNELVALGAERLPEVKAQLFDRFDQYDHFYSDEVDFEYASAEECYKACRPSLFVLDGVKPLVLRFKVEWDPEHGAGLEFCNGKFEWVP